MAAGGACVLLLCLVYALAVCTRRGQLLEDAVLDAYLAVSTGPRARVALDALAHISVFSLAGAVVAVFAIGIVRRRPLLAVTSSGLIVASVVVTEFVKLAVVRPLLLDSGVHRENQSFPSGHTTIAISVMCGLALVAPYRARVAAVFLGSLWGIGIAVATVTGNWHRPSDTIGSELITLACTCAALILLARHGRVRQAPPAPGRVGGILSAALYALTATAALAIAAVRQDILTTGWAIALAGGCLTALALLALLGTADFAAPAPPRTSPPAPARAPAHVPSAAGPPESVESTPISDRTRRLGLEKIPEADRRLRLDQR
ncbi:phosphatase PAP2 family protein [Thermopolyspora sp. NPDC052614]|uniref:phosphatase PAP2 family protein n=1 Tax=Thermopolyspora sp. NPDC052614 TaxID=3155682 RepID=UPI003445EFAB